MTTIPAIKLAALGLCFALVSCVAGERDLVLDVPTGARPATKGKARITQVSDSRQFQNKPSDPSTPSTQGDVNALSPSERGRFVGRQRNTYGGAMGEVVLGNGQTASSKTRDLVTEALARRGYAVGNSGTPVSVDIRKFWAWMTPGMWTIGLEARIEAVVRVNGRSLTVKGYGDRNAQAATSSNWELVYERTMENFLKNLEAQLSKAGL